MVILPVNPAPMASAKMIPVFSVTSLMFKALPSLFDFIQAREKTVEDGFG